MINRAPATFDSWGVVEEMGFKKLAGRITEQQIAGSSLIRVDVPEILDEDGAVRSAAYSKLIGVGSIYMITPTDEDTARKAAAVLERGNSPLPVYIPPATPRLQAGSVVEPEGDWDDDGELRL